MTRVVAKILGTLALATFLVAPAAQGASISFFLDSYGSDPAGVRATLDDMTNVGFLTVTLETDAIGDLGGQTADLRGLWLDFDPAPDPDLEEADIMLITGILTEVAFDTLNTGGGNNINGDIPNTFRGDLALEIGTSGMSPDDIQVFSVKIAGLNVSQVSGIAARATSVGGLNSTRSGSDKLFLARPDFPPTGDEEVPEPATLTLMGAGLLGLMYFRRRRN